MHSLGRVGKRWYLREYVPAGEHFGDRMIRTLPGRRLREVEKEGRATPSPSESNSQQRKPEVAILPANRRGRLPEGLGVKVERGAQAIADELEQLGFTVKFMDVNPWPLNPLAHKPSMLKAIDPLRAFKILLSWRRPDIVLSYFESGVLLLALLGRIFLFRVPIVILDIGVGGQSRLRNLFLRIIIPRVDAIFVLGSDQMAYIRRNYSTKAKVRFTPTHVDARFFAPQHPAEEYILAVGDDISRDYATLLKAVSGLDAKVVLKTRKFPENMDIYPHVSVITARLSDTELRELYDKAKLVVMPLHPTLTAGGVTALLEAMAMGKAQIVSQSAGLKDYLVSGENCVTVPCYDVEALRDAIVQLLNDDNLRKKLGKSARRYAESEFSTRQLAKRLSDQFHLFLKQ